MDIPKDKEDLLVNMFHKTNQRLMR